MIVELILLKPDEEGNIAFTSNSVKSITMRGRTLSILHGDEGKIFYAKKGNIKCMTIEEDKE